jgi:hypothetical protein
MFSQAIGGFALSMVRSQRGFGAVDLARADVDKNYPGNSVIMGALELVRVCRFRREPLTLFSVARMQPETESSKSRWSEDKT